MSIYVIADQFEVDSYGGSDVEERIDPDYGYFTDREQAQECADALDAPDLALHAKRQASYEKRLAQWEEKHDRARKLGFSNPDLLPRRPDRPRTRLVIEIKPGRTK